MQRKNPNIEGGAVNIERNDGIEEDSEARVLPKTRKNETIITTVTTRM